MADISEHAVDKEHQIVGMPVSQLLLDKDNPRLASTVTGNSQFDLLKVLWTEQAVDELILSIAANGFFPEEPLFVIPEHPNADGNDPSIKFIVIEGNRRLAAVLILLHDNLRKDLRVTNLPEIGADTKNQLRVLPVSKYQNREELWAYLSFRHINTAKPWDAFSKAKYVAHVHEDYHIPLDVLARRIGDKHSTVLRLYRGYKVLQQAEEQGGYQVNDRLNNHFAFSHLYTALAYTEFQTFLGINPEFPENDPVPHTHLKNLSDLMTWLYGKKSAGIQPIIRAQNPDLSILREVVSNPLALDA